MSRRPDQNTPRAEIVTALNSSQGKMLKRTEAARMLGVSVSTLRRREGELINPVVGPGGVHLFDEAEVRSTQVTIRRRQAVGSIGPALGETAAEVFTLLDEKVHPIEIVKRLKLAPDVVESLQEQWTHLKGGFVVYEQEAQDLAIHSRGVRAKSGHELAEQINARLQSLLRRHNSPTCRICGESAACYCEKCVSERLGPLYFSGLNLERRNNENGDEEVRAVIHLTWSETLEDREGASLPFSSRWYRRKGVGSSFLAEFVEALEPAGTAHTPSC